MVGWDIVLRFLGRSVRCTRSGSFSDISGKAGIVLEDKSLQKVGEGGGEGVFERTLRGEGGGEGVDIVDGNGDKI